MTLAIVLIIFAVVVIAGFAGSSFSADGNFLYARKSRNRFSPSISRPSAISSIPPRPTTCVAACRLRNSAQSSESVCTR